jgi:hypothetical protein
MRLRSFAFGAGALVVVATLCFAQGAAKKSPRPPAKPAAMAPMPMGPPPEMSKVSWLTGNWTCSGKTFASPEMGPAHPTEATVSAGSELGGRWMISHYREKKTAQNTMPVEADEYWTYDGAEKKWDRVAIDNFGGWSSGDAKDWQNNAITWMNEGMMAGKKFKERATFTKKSDREVFYKGDIQGKDGKWMPAWETTCHK